MSSKTRWKERPGWIHDACGEPEFHKPSGLPGGPLVVVWAVLPLLHRTHEWWECNSSKLIVAVVLAIVTLTYYQLRGSGFGHGEHAAAAGFPTVLKVLDHAVIVDYIPFIVLLFSLFTISGGISLRGDIPAHPITNTIILAIGGGLASFIGTTGSSTRSRIS